MTRSGELYPLPRQERPISATGGGSWRTPTAADWKNMGSSTQVYLSDQVRPSQVTTSKKPGVWHIPTPTSADVYTGNLESSQQSDDSMHSVSLPDFVGRFPTPSTMDHIDRKQMRPSRAATNRKTGYLSEMIGQWPTPTPWQQDESVENWTERREREKAKGRNGNGFGIPLDMAARMLPTPNSRANALTPARRGVPESRRAQSSAS